MVVNTTEVTNSSVNLAPRTGIGIQCPERTEFALFTEIKITSLETPRSCLLHHIWWLTLSLEPRNTFIEIDDAPLTYYNKKGIETLSSCMNFAYVHMDGFINISKRGYLQALCCSKL